MISDTEIKLRGMNILSEHLGEVEAERFIALIQRESFDYTKWRQENQETSSIDELNHRAMAHRAALEREPRA